MVCFTSPGSVIYISFFSSFPESRYTVLGGQHSCRAVWSLRKELIEKGLPVPHSLNFVRGNVLKSSTPLSVRMAAGGDHQFAQEQVTSMAVSQLIKHLVLGDTESTEPTQSLLKRCISGVRRAGWDRPETEVCVRNFHYRYVIVLFFFPECVHEEVCTPWTTS